MNTVVAADQLGAGSASTLTTIGEVAGETVVVADPAPGRWRVVVDPWHVYRTASITAAAPAPPGRPLLVGALQVKSADSVIGSSQVRLTTAQ